MGAAHVRAGLDSFYGAESACRCYGGRKARCREILRAALALTDDLLSLKPSCPQPPSSGAREVP